MLFYVFHLYDSFMEWWYKKPEVVQYVSDVSTSDEQSENTEHSPECPWR